jgi:hypothetical protein
MGRITLALAVAVLAAAVAGCSAASSSSTTSQAGTSSAAPSGNAQVCQDVAKQVNWLAARQATITVEDIVYFGAWIKMDEADATGQLRTDLSKLYAAYQYIIQTGQSDPQAGHRVRSDCAAIGVTVN